MRNLSVTVTVTVTFLPYFDASQSNSMQFAHEMKTAPTA